MNMRTKILRAAAVAVFAMASAGFAQTSLPDFYTITKSSDGLFRASRGGSFAANQSIQSVIDAVISNAAGMNAGMSVGMQFGYSGDTLDIGSQSIEFSRESSASELKIYFRGGTITSSGSGTIKVKPNVSVTVNNGAEIAYTGTGVVTDKWGCGICNDGGTVSIEGGKVSAGIIDDYLPPPLAKRQSSPSAAAINPAMKNAVSNFNGGTLNIRGGSVGAIEGYAVFNGSRQYGNSAVGGTVNVSGGSMSARGRNVVILNGSGGTVNITGGTVYTSEVTDIAVYNGYGSLLNITGGAIESLFPTSAYAVYNTGNTGTGYFCAPEGEPCPTDVICGCPPDVITPSTAIITGGAMTGRVENGNGARIVLGGSPAISGDINTDNGVEVVPHNDMHDPVPFAPDDKIYRIRLAGEVSEGRAAVVGGAGFLGSFTLVNPGWGLMEIADSFDLVARQLTPNSVLSDRRVTPSAKPLVSLRGNALTLSAPANTVYAIRLIDVRGKTVKRVKLSGGGSFSLAKIPAGRYFVEAREGGKVEKSAVIVGAR